MIAWRRVRGLLAPGPAPAKPAPAAGPPPKAPPAAKPPPAAAAAPRPQGTRYVAVTVLGLSGEALDQVIATAQSQCAAKGARPAFITDGHDFAPFRRRRLVVDQVVDAEARRASAPDLAWSAYRRRQYGLIAARWRPVAVISFGRSPDEDCLDVLQPAAARPAQA